MIKIKKNKQEWDYLNVLDLNYFSEHKIFNIHIIAMPTQQREKFFITCKALCCFRKCKNKTVLVQKNLTLIISTLA